MEEGMETDLIKVLRGAMSMVLREENKNTENPKTGLDLVLEFYSLPSCSLENGELNGFFFKYEK